MLRFSLAIIPLIALATACGSTAFKSSMGSASKSDSAAANATAGSGDLTHQVTMSSEYTTATTDSAGTPGMSSGTGGSEPLPTNGSGTDGDIVSKDEAAECAGHSGVDVKSVKIAGAGHVQALTADDVVAIKVTGSKNKFALKLDGKATKALCVFVAGNQNEVTIDLSADLGALYYKGRGNQSKGVITVAVEHKLGTTSFDLAGNSATVQLTGAGTYPCDDVNTKGHNAKVTCGK